MPPAEEGDAVAHSRVARERFKGGAFRAVTREDEVRAGEVWESTDEDIEALVGVEAPGRQDRRAAGRNWQGRGGRAGEVGNEIRKVADAACRPSLSGDPAGEGAGVGDQVGAATIV